MFKLREVGRRRTSNALASYLGDACLLEDHAGDKPLSGSPLWCSLTLADRLDFSYGSSMPSCHMTRWPTYTLTWWSRGDMAEWHFDQEATC